MKQQDFEIETPERVRLKYVPAESATRAIAFLIDALIQSGIALVVVFALLGFQAWNIRGPFRAFTILTLFTIQWGYGFFFETRMGGRTPGKAAMRIRIVRQDGLPLDIRTVAIRNILRGVDGLPFMLAPLLGGFVTASDPLSRRIGDIIAGTVVVKEQSRLIPNPDFSIPPGRSGTRIAMDPRRKPLDERELSMLRRFLQTWESLPEQKRDMVLEDFALRIASRTGIPKGDDAAVYLRTVYETHRPCATERFFQERHEDWFELGRFLEGSQTGSQRLSSVTACRFISLFRKASGDLAAARSRNLAPDFIEYLNAIVGEARAIVYNAEAGIGGSFLLGLLKAPRAVFNRPWFVLTSFLLFCVPFTGSWFAANKYPSHVARWSDPGLLRQMTEAYSSLQFGEGGGDEAKEMTAFYIANNVSIDLATIAGGALFGAGSIFFLVENGLTLGSVLGFVHARGSGPAILRFITAHSVFEIGGFIIAGAAGLLLGWTLLKAGPSARIEAVRSAMDDFLPLAVISTFLTFAAAFLEAWVSPSAASWTIRILIASLCLSCLIGWFLIAFALTRPPEKTR